MSDPQMSLSEAVLAMLAMVIVLCFVLFYYCILPCYNNYKKHHWVSQKYIGWMNKNYSDCILIELFKFRCINIKTFVFNRQENKQLGKIGRVIQGGITINFNLYRENQPTTSRIRNIAVLEHAAEHLGMITNFG